MTAVYIIAGALFLCALYVFVFCLGKISARLDERIERMFQSKATAARQRRSMK